MGYPPAPCGTKQARRRHRKHGETCADCALNRPKINDSIVDVLTTHDRWLSVDLLVDFVLDLHPEWRADSVERAVWRLRKSGVIESRTAEFTYADGLSGHSVNGRVRTYEVAEFRADDSAWEKVA